MFELSFLNTSLLIFATATVLPLLIWLLAKKKPQKIVFSNLRFIRLSKQQEKSRSKLKNILLLIIRMLIILLVTLAVARPMFSTPKLKPSKKHPPTAIAILLDTSFSMDYADGGKSMLQQAKEAILDVNSRTNTDDQIVVISSDSNWNQMNAQLFAGQISLQLIEGIEITHSPISLEEMQKLAAAKLQESQMPNQEMYLLSDNRLEPMKLVSSVPIAAIPLPENPDYENLSCISATSMPQLVDKKRHQQIKFTVENHGRKDRQDVLVKVILGNIKVAEQFVSIPGRASKTETIAIDLREDGWQSGYVEIADEKQAQDNRAYFAFPFYSKPRIAVISKAKGLPHILESLFNVYSDGGISIVDPENLSLASLDAYQLIVVYDNGSLSPKLREILTVAQNKKLGILYVLGSTLAPDMKAHLNSTFGIEIEGKSQKAINIDQINRHQYISMLIADKLLKNNVIADYWQADNKGANAIVSGSTNPLVVQSNKQVLWLWNITSNQNPFFIDPAFPVLAFRTLDFIAGTDNPEIGRLIGETLVFERLRLPNGEILSNRRHVVTEPGIYTLEPDTPRETAIAVNINHEDSQARYNPPLGVMRLGKNWQDRLFYSRLGHDLWKTLLTIAFVLVLLEIIIVKWEETRAKV